MRFNEWWAMVQKEHQKLTSSPIYEISESISIDGKVITITLDPDSGQPKVEIDDEEDAYFDLRSLYSPHKEEFDALLDSITERNRELGEGAQILLQAVGDEMVPELTLKRLAGEALTSEGSSGVLMVRALAEKKLNELGSIFLEIPKVMTYTLVVDVRGKEMYFNDNEYGKLIKWSHLEWKKQSGVLSETIPNIPDCLELIAHFDQFKATLEALKTGMLTLGRLIKNRKEVKDGRYRYP